MTAHDPKETTAEFHRVVNMTPAALEKWLATDESRSVGMVEGGGIKSEPGGAEAVGHHMGHRIVEIRRTRQADLRSEDYADMRKVISYVHRHLAQRPKNDIDDSRWRRSLMNWGHDPLED